MELGHLRTLIVQKKSDDRQQQCGGEMNYSAGSKSQER